MKRLLPTRTLILALGFAGLLMLPLAVLAAPQAQIPDIPHVVTGREKCLVCHDIEKGFKPAPADHEGRTEDICTGCHQASGVETESAPQAPHPLEGREECLACHAAGGVKPVPASHEKRTNPTCPICHASPVAAAEPTAEATAEAEATPAAEATAAPTEAAEEPQFPAIPHPLEGRDDCLSCHGPSGVKPTPSDHKGRTNGVCRDCHQPLEAKSEQAGPTIPIPFIPHVLVGRKDCLSCHALGGVKPMPENHVGRNNDICLNCHVTQDMARPILPEAIPTPPASVPAVEGANSCLTCHRSLGGKHEKIISQWEESTHAARDVSCADCHGGDPNDNSMEGAMDPDAGYIGPISRFDIPDVCGSCHSNVDMMRQYNLRTDQLREYRTSYHGQLLAQGNMDVATCVDCHGSHDVFKVNDPGSPVYPGNEPATCAKCHANANMMAPYGIPTDQYELYKGSIHGIKVLKEQDPRAPTCSTCHGTHGATPPGFAEVSNVCGQCHAQTEDYYLEGRHNSVGGKGGTPRCVTCHGRYDVQPATLDLFLGEEPRHCGNCHTAGSPISEMVNSIYKTIREARASYETAENAIAQAKAQGFITGPAEEELQKAKTALIELRALQHTVLLPNVDEKATEVKEVSADVTKKAQDALSEGVVRRQGMVVSIIGIAITIGLLYLIKRELDREWAERNKS